MFTIGALIWISLRPLLRLAIGVSCGILITKADMFPPVAARGAGQVILNVTIPCLLFSKIVPAFDADNIRVFGPLFLVASIYEILGIAIAWVTKQVFWVPHRFRYGILVAGGWGNVGDIPVSVVLSVTGAAPFNGTSDQNLSVAYVSVFILVFTLSLFPMGAHRWVAMDYVGPDVETRDTKEALKLKQRKLLFLSTLSEKKPDEDLEKNPTRPKPIEEEEREKPVSSNEDEDNTLANLHTIHDDAHSTTIAPTSEIEAETSPCTNQQPSNDDLKALASTCPSPIQALSQFHPTRTPLRTRLTTFLKSLLSAPSLSILLAFPIALVPALKALFTPVPSAHIPNAPDGQPPLAFLLDTATFIGAASVPLGLVCLGAALARLKMPQARIDRSDYPNHANDTNDNDNDDNDAGHAKGAASDLPLGAIASLAAGKLLLMPVLGVLIVRGLVRTGFVPESDKVLQFVCIFCSCLPTATTQVYLTQVYSGTGEAEHLAPFLIPQYILMFISMTALTAYTLHLIF